MSPRARVLFLLVCVLAAAVCVRLGFWQRDRLHQRRAANARIEAGRALPGVVLPGTREPLAHRRVEARGEYDFAQEMLVRNVAYREQPGVYVLTPLRLEGSDTALLVNRGFLPAPDGMTVPFLDSLREAGSQVVRGLAFPLDSTPDGGQPVRRDGRVTWRTLDRAELPRRLPYPVLPVVLLQAPDAALPTLPRRLEPRPLDDGSHLSYMLQWFAFAAIFLAGGIIVASGRRVPRWSEPTQGAPAAGGPRPPPPA